MHQHHVPDQHHLCPLVNTWQPVLARAYAVAGLTSLLFLASIARA